MVVLKEPVNWKCFTENLIVKPSNLINIKYQKTSDGSAEYLAPKNFITYFHIKQDDINVEVLSQ